MHYQIFSKYDIHLFDATVKHMLPYSLAAAKLLKVSRVISRGYFYFLQITILPDHIKIINIETYTFWRERILIFFSSSLAYRISNCIRRRR